MKTATVSFNEPKTKKSALNLVVYALDRIERIRIRKENIMNNQESVQAKIEKLQKTLQELSNQIAWCDNATDTWAEKIEKLKVDFTLTEAEILELKSSLLRSQIAQAEKELKMQRKNPENI